MHRLARRVARLDPGWRRRSAVAELARVEARLDHLLDQAEPLKGQALVAAFLRVRALADTLLELRDATMPPAEEANPGDRRPATNDELAAMLDDFYAREPRLARCACLSQRAYPAMTDAQLDEHMAYGACGR